MTASTQYMTCAHVDEKPNRSYLMPSFPLEKKTQPLILLVGLPEDPGSILRIKCQVTHNHLIRPAMEVLMPLASLVTCTYMHICTYR